MNTYRVSLLAAFLGLALGNFIYQCFSKQNYSVAIDRTFFQGIALFAIWITNRIGEWLK
jgi:hypothetical protein